MRWEGFMEVVQNQHRCMLLISIGSSMQGMRVYARNQRHSGQTTRTLKARHPHQSPSHQHHPFETPKSNYPHPTKHIDKECTTATHSDPSTK